MNSPQRNVALTFLAHPDDAEILCAGTLLRLAEAGWELHIVTCTAGDCGTMIENAFDISSIRTTEAQKAAQKLGAQYHCLGEQDGRVIYDKPTVQKAIDLFRRIAPTLVFTHAAKDYMLDHEQASLLARQASFMYGAPNSTAFPLLPGSAIPHLYYCDPVEAVDPLGNEVQPTTVIDVSAQMQRKTELLACHASQREWLRAHHGIDEYINAMQRHNQHRGEQAGLKYAEAFVQHRGHAYPRNDLLTELFGSKR